MHWTEFRCLTAALLLAISAAANAADCRLSTHHWNQMHYASIALIRESGEQTELRVRVADEPRERAAGFQHICPEIIKLSAILFIYDRAENRSFHMSNVHAELDIGFFDADGHLFQVTRMKPRADGSSGTNFYSPGLDAQYALETRAGYFSEHRLVPGAVRLSFH